MFCCEQKIVFRITDCRLSPLTLYLASYLKSTHASQVINWPKLHGNDDTFEGILSIVSFQPRKSSSKKAIFLKKQKRMT